MTAREYAKAVGIEVVGKLKRKIATHEKYDVLKGDFVEEKFAFFVDEVGNEFMKCNDGESWVAVTADGGVI